MGMNINVREKCNNTNNNNNNSVLIYLRENLTAQRPVTKLARVRKRNSSKTQTKYKIRQFI
jgi:hypothetical protein